MDTPQCMYDISDVYLLSLFSLLLSELDLYKS